MVLLDLLIPTFSPQGDGNSESGRNPRAFAFWIVDPYLFPARGRKHVVNTIVVVAGYHEPTVDPYLFPARGRKQLIRITVNQHS